MFTAKEYAMPQNLEEAYKLLTSKKTNYILGGCAWLRMGNRRMTTAIDLSLCDLDFIRETEHTIEIGAMTSYRTVEKSDILHRYFNGCISHCISSIVGTQFRNTVTVGGSVFGRYGFSDFLPTLLALDTTVVLYHKGEVALEDFMKMSYQDKDIIVKIIIQKNGAVERYQHFRNSDTDFPVLNLAVSKSDQGYKVVVGARAEKAVIAPKTSAFLSGADWSSTAEVIGQAQEILVSEIKFSGNMRASADYRRYLSQVLLKRAIEEVEACR